MPRPKLSEARDTRAEILALAVELVQTHGFTAFSYQDLSDRLHIRKASIHYHFPTKEELGNTLLEAYIEGFREWSQQVLAQGMAPTQMVESYFELFLGISDDCSRICPCAAFAAEWSALPEGLRKSVGVLLATHRDWIQEVIRRGQASGEFSHADTPEQQAQLIFASVQGVLQTARVQSNPGLYRGVTKALMTNLKSV